MKKAVSICVPTYKQTEYLKRCIDSILQQDYKDFELIISDDTPDDSIEVFLKSILKDQPYSYFRNNPSLGTPENWNAAVGNAEGKYIKIMHHDDFFTRPDSLKLMVEEIEKKQASFLFCQTDVWHVKTQIHHIHKISAKQLELLKRKPQFLFFKNMIGAPSATLYINNKAFSYDKRFKWLVDIDLYMKYLFHSQKLAYLELPLVCTAHDTEGQVTGSVISDKEIQIREHVLLFNKVNQHKINESGFASFFDYLFFKYDIRSYAVLEAIVPEANENKLFFKKVIGSVGLNRSWKWLKKRFFESRYNNYIFKFEQFI
ncbi:MAG: glycosyl transferase family 2 [Bacteroidetes bacterium]|jgi:glycosyltransferase involved in cell wall biosynthesis|nr:glycosyl transferase family 2 [Bacteroidota bacterium]MDF2452468.1 glycosyl transferase family 2 [Bacteroidota bacterium]